MIIGMSNAALGRAQLDLWMRLAVRGSRSGVGRSIPEGEKPTIPAEPGFVSAVESHTIPGCLSGPPTDLPGRWKKLWPGEA
jgi:hypothetical protein